MGGRVSARTNGTTPWLSLVELDAELGVHEPGWSAPGAQRLAARSMHLAEGPFDPREFVPNPHGWLGLLIVSGQLLVEIEAGRGPTGWLVGPEDLLRPWEMDELALTADGTWTALSESEIVLLDADFARRTLGIADVSRALLAKSAQSTHWLLAKSLITATPVIEERLLLLFALIGERWGRATPEGVMISLPLTHRVLASLVGARRPSVSTALGALDEEGLVSRVPRDGWLARRPPPLADPSPRRCWERYVQALGFGPASDEAVRPRTETVIGDPAGGTQIGENQA
jgi:CRP/FNR family transcriptional regulator, cyclic AMP receptor protein